MSKIAIVTGSNRGIGHSIVKGLAKAYNGIVYLTARDEASGKQAVEELKKEGANVSFHQLDIDNLASIKRFATYIKEKHGGLDLLVNNAAIAYKAASTAPFGEQAEVSIRVNYTGTLNMCNEFFPLLRPHARVVHVSSRAGMLKVVKDAEMRAKLSSADVTISEITAILDKFVEAAKNGTNENIATTAYGMSKVGVTAATRVQQRIFDKDPREDIIVNCCCPGLVATNMSSFHEKGKPVDEGAITPLFLALIPEGASGPKGELYAEKERVDWGDMDWTWSRVIKN